MKRHVDKCVRQDIILENVIPVNLSHDWKSASTHDNYSTKADSPERLEVRELSIALQMFGLRRHKTRIHSIYHQRIDEGISSGLIFVSGYYT